MREGMVFEPRPAGARWRIAAWAGAAALVVVPVLAWRAYQPFAFEPGHGIMAALVTLVSGLAYEIAVRLPARRTLAGGLALNLLGILTTVWFNGAVGIIGSEDDPANRMFLVPIGIALAGLAVASYRPGVAALVLVMATFGQLGTFFHALAAGYGFIGPITVFFCAIWLAASFLYRRAERHRARSAAVDPVG